MELRPDIATAAAELTPGFDVEREIRQLSFHLDEQETVRRLTSGVSGTGVGLMAVTDHRVLLLRIGRAERVSEDLRLDRLSSVAWAARAARGTITLTGSKRTIELKQVPLAEGARIVELIESTSSGKRSRRRRRTLFGGGYPTLDQPPTEPTDEQGRPGARPDQAESAAPGGVGMVGAPAAKSKNPYAVTVTLLTESPNLIGARPNSTPAPPPGPVQTDAPGPIVTEAPQPAPTMVDTPALDTAAVDTPPAGTPAVDIPAAETPPAGSARSENSDAETPPIGSAAVGPPTTTSPGSTPAPPPASPSRTSQPESRTQPAQRPSPRPRPEPATPSPVDPDRSRIVRPATGEVPSEPGYTPPAAPPDPRPAATPDRRPIGRPPAGRPPAGRPPAGRPEANRPEAKRGKSRGWLGVGVIAGLIGLAVFAANSMSSPAPMPRPEAASAPAPAPTGPNPPVDGVVVTVVKVFDVNSIEVAGAVGGPVEILGINPPLAAKNQCASAEAEARAFATGALIGNTVTLITDPSPPAPDPAGRRFASLRLPSGTDYAVLAAGVGMATSNDIARPPALATETRAAQGQAERARLGLWGPPCTGGFAPTGSLPGSLPTTG